MNASERYLTVYNDDMRNKLDRVPTFVQNILDEFTVVNKVKILDSYNGDLFGNLYFDIPFILGFESIFAPFPSSLKFRLVKIEDEAGNKFRIREDGQPVKRESSYYQGGFIHSLEILDDIRATQKRIDRTQNIQDVINWYEKLSPKIFPILMVGGIFDTLWQSMGMNQFSRHFRKKTKLYAELIKFYAEITKINIEGLIEATGDRGKIVNILDDVAFKGRVMIAPERWNQDFLPYYKEISSIITDAGMIPQIHTDGDVTEMIPSFQRAGFRGLQGWEGGCDPYYINDNFPDFVVIGFGDVSDILPFGTPEQIETHVKDLMSALKENRHFIIGPSTVIFKEIPLKNVEIFMQAVNKHGQY